MLKKRFFTVAMMVVLAIFFSQMAFSAPVADPDGYWNLFNVYSFNDIGVYNSGDTESWYGSDFEGVGGAGGDAYFDNFGLNLLGQYSHGGRPVALYTGGDAYLAHGDFHGGIEAGGDVNLAHFTIDGDVRAQSGTLTTGGGTPTLNNQIYGSAYSNGGLLSGVDVKNDLDSTAPVTLQDNTQVFGTAYHSGNVTFLDTSGAGATAPGASPNATHTYMDHTDVQDYFAGLSQDMEVMADQNATVVITPPWPPWKSAVAITVTGGVLNVVNLTAAQTVDFVNAGVITITSVTGPDAVLYVNLDLSLMGAAFDFAAMDIQLNNVEYKNVIFNFSQVGNYAIGLHNALYPNLLMPYADVTFFDGRVGGRLIVNNLVGACDRQIEDGQVDLPDGYIPEPATMALLLSGISGLVATRLRRRKRS